MTIRHWAAAMAILTCWGACLEETLAQTLGPNTVTTPSLQNSTRSGMNIADRGSFEPMPDSQDRVGRSAENVRELLRMMRGIERQRRRTEKNIDNLNKTRRSRQKKQAQQNPPPPVHVHLQPSFSFHRAPPAKTARAMQARISRLLKKRDTGSVHIELHGQTATLTGTVQSEYQQRLLETMVQIEPGIATVENLVVIEERLAAPRLAPAQ